MSPPVIIKQCSFCVKTFRNPNVCIGTAQFMKRRWKFSRSSDTEILNWSRHSIRRRNCLNSASDFVFRYQHLKSGWLINDHLRTPLLQLKVIKPHLQIFFCLFFDQNRLDHRIEWIVVCDEVEKRDFLSGAQCHKWFRAGRVLLRQRWR